ncbi:HAD family hydrolase [Leifsonia sp. NPDC056665]|uniref:HAD family hydrolase n=1 Tax=Leifsonia sp. NPDC056665 TaxID=3345901 RepID=UPI0036D09856
MDTRRRLSVFDLDGVLIHGDTMGALVLGRLREHPLRLFAALPLFVAAQILPGTSLRRARLHRVLVSLALRGLDRDSYIMLARRTGLRLALRGSPNRQAIAELKRLASEHQVVVATASEFHLARAYIDAIGLPGVRVLASQLGFDGASPHLVVHNVGAMKVESLRTNGYNLHRFELYTDSTSDLPLARVANKTTLINPSRRSTRRFRSQIPSAEIHRWS